jgi:hypothetical protein
VAVHFAKVLEAVGLACTSYALFVGFSQEHSMGPELSWMLGGAVIFLLGYVIDSKASA